MKSVVLCSCPRRWPSFRASDRRREAKAQTEAAKSDLPPLPADARVKQVTHVAGKTFSYTAIVRALPVRDDKGKKTAEVVFTG